MSELHCIALFETLLSSAKKIQTNISMIYLPMLRRLLGRNDYSVIRCSSACKSQNRLLGGKD